MDHSRFGLFDSLFSVNIQKLGFGLLILGAVCFSQLRRRNNNTSSFSALLFLKHIQVKTVPLQRLGLDDRQNVPIVGPRQGRGVVGGKGGCREAGSLGEST